MFKGEVEFRNVEFAYPSRPESLVLRNFNFRVTARHTAGLVGTSGSGKSTIISLTERVYDALQGEIFFDGVEIRTLQLMWLRNQMGLVSQESVLFATSIKKNTLFGKNDASVEEVGQLGIQMSEDSIAAIQSGQLVESGSHDQLIQNMYRPYSAMVQLQQTFMTNESSSKQEEPKSSQTTEALRNFAQDEPSHNISKENQHYHSDEHGTPSLWRMMKMTAPEWKQTLVGCVGVLCYGVIPP
ncbi:hypothetical protein GIB67_027764 [Kingdonia uniflora]|uniref:ABC transporter domain-containing protein n=1 Tax=Kingdonia uniflora TaxID=39325 RepID=A0A7J7PD15_9MAGN|nr:hypothetical protein GIB67_027764 [Kingdonia uniflora]